MKTYKIYQLKSAPYMFMNWDFAKAHGFNLEDYDLVYSLEGDYSLDYLFDKFNRDLPDDFRGHSMSTSDVVEVDGELYYCDWFGWQRV